MGFNVSCAQDMVWSRVLKDIRTSYPDVQHVSTDELATMLSDADGVVPILLDVRETEEYAISHLAGAIQINPDLKDLSALSSLAPDTPIIAYCSVGYRSSALVEQLQKSGFNNVMNLEGSIFQWANAGLPVVRDDSTVQAVHPYNAVWGKLLDAKLRAYTP